MTEDPNKYRITFEIDRGKLFEAIRMMEHNSGPLGDRIVGMMLMGKASFADDVGMAFYGVTVLDEDRLEPIKSLAAEAYANDFPLGGGDVARALANAGLLTREEFASMVEPHSAEAATAIRREPSAADVAPASDSNIPF